MAMLNANGIGMTIIDNRNAIIGDTHNNQMIQSQKPKKTSSVNSRTAKDNWKSL
jgi:hypothetical protein